MQLSQSRIKAIIITAVVAVVLLIGLSLYSFLAFRITSTTPDPNNYPSSLGVIKLTFNRKLDEQMIQEQFKASSENVVKFSFDSTSIIRVDDKTLIITIGRTPLPGKYSIQLANIKATDGSTYKGAMSFIVKSIPYRNLTAADKILFDEASVDGETLPDSPLVGVLPHETNDYKISYVFPPETVELPPTITITMKFFKPGDVALPATPQQTQAYLVRLRTSTNEALGYLTSKNIDPKDYVMKYTEPLLRSEFPVGYQAAPESE